LGDVLGLEGLDFGHEKFLGFLHLRDYRHVVGVVVIGRRQFLCLRLLQD